MRRGLQRRAGIGVPLWSETRWNTVWNMDAGVGLYLHLGRFRRDLDYWWAQVVAYLPDSELCVTRLWGRNEPDAGVGIAPCSSLSTPRSRQAHPAEHVRRCRTNDRMDVT